MPSSYAVGSLAERDRRRVVLPNRPHGQLTVTVTPDPGVSMLPLSSVARDLIVTGPLPAADHV